MLFKWRKDHIVFGGSLIPTQRQILIRELFWSSSGESFSTSNHQVQTHQAQTIQVQMFTGDVEKLGADDRHSEERLLSEDVVPQQQLHTRLSMKKILLTHLFILASYTILLLFAWRMTVQASCPFLEPGGSEAYRKSKLANLWRKLTESSVPAARVIEVETQLIDLDSPNPFKGKSSLEFENAWDELLHGKSK